MFVYVPIFRIYFTIYTKSHFTRFPTENWGFNNNLLGRFFRPSSFYSTATQLGTVSHLISSLSVFVQQTFHILEPFIGLDCCSRNFHEYIFQLVGIATETRFLNKKWKPNNSKRFEMPWNCSVKRFLMKMNRSGVDFQQIRINKKKKQK